MSESGITEKLRQTLHLECLKLEFPTTEISQFVIYIKFIASLCHYSSYLEPEM